MPLPKPHRKLVKHFDERGVIHELTFSCCHRWPILDNESRQQLGIHLNPVRRGLVQRATDYRASSARWYASDGQEVEARLPQLSAVPPEWFAGNSDVTSY